VLFFAFIDMVIDPVALRGDRWFLGRIYYYPDPGIHFGVPLANYLGWAVVGSLSLAVYVPLERRLPPLDIDLTQRATGPILLGCGLYLGVLVFNLAVTFWIGEPLQGLTGLFMFLPIMILALLRLSGALAPRDAS
jgi:putative membrane protein